MVYPVIGQIDDAQGLPMVRHIAGATVYYARHLVIFHEFKILGRQLVSEENLEETRNPQ